MMHELTKAYKAYTVEETWYRFWEEHDYFSPDFESDKPRYCIVIPPPNVTGSLHMGHAFNNTLQDILIRWKRMEGYNTWWVAGMDHAGIATQNVVERVLAAEGKRREDLGREKFIERVWQWKEEAGGMIISQLKRLGASCDWKRCRFTMDEGLSRAVRTVFVQLYHEGLIYRSSNYMISWCPRCLTALSDLEVEHAELEGALYYVKYPSVEDGGDGIVVATTRPETILGDTAVAVNPHDRRYVNLIGKMVLLPVLDRKIPIIADEYVDPEFGTGALKITPGHDPNDFEVGLRHHLPQVTAIDEHGKMNAEAGKYQGLDRSECRKQIVEDLKKQGLLMKVEPYKHAVGHCYRCHNIIEPRLSTQWFVKMKDLAEPAIETVKSGKIRIIPNVWENTYHDWMDNIRDWCISRQIWWGHQIPAWFCDDCGEITVSMEDAQQCSACGSKQITRETDVLDTWFSSALWPFSTMGWPEKTKALEMFYPTSVLVTGFDILFFWVARMIMAGLKFCQDIPFYDVYIHALVRDAEGQKMSKSKGNVIDPLLMMDKYGTDAFRFTLAVLATQGRDIKLSESRIEGYRHFVNKLWNAARFTFANLADFDPSLLPKNARYADRGYSLADQWILSRLQAIIQEIRVTLEEYKFNEAAHAIYQFIWHEFCDWYIELSKLSLYHPQSPQEKATTQMVLTTVLETTLRLLHPFMPYVTEEIWQHLPKACRDPDSQSIMVAPFPKADPQSTNKDAERRMNLLMGVISKIRTIRSEVNVPLSASVNVFLRTDDQNAITLLNQYDVYISNLVKAAELTIGTTIQKPRSSAADIFENVEIFVPLEGVVDLDSESARLQKEIEKIGKEIARLDQKLNNEQFLQRAPEHVVQKERTKYQEYLESQQKLQAHFEKMRSFQAQK